jgi:hypothetical protein
VTELYLSFTVVKALDNDGYLLLSSKTLNDCSSLKSFAIRLSTSMGGRAFKSPTNIISCLIFQK